MVTFRVPAMTSRHSVRMVSASVCDVPGVRTVEADPVAGTLDVTGSADPAEVQAAITAAGYEAGRCIRSGSTDDPAATGRTAMDTSMHTAPADVFATATDGLPEAVPTRPVALAHGESAELRIAPVVAQIDDAPVRMLAYNGSVPGPTLTVRQHSEVTVTAVNEGDLETTVHWHGLRLDNRYDGVPYETQAPIAVGESHTYRLTFPDPGLYWYHPHIREDYTQEMGLYGNILVLPEDPDYWPPAHRDVVLTLDDVLIEDGAIAPFRRDETTHAAMGRFGNVLLVGGRTDQALTARPGEVVRFWLTNTANTRVFDVRLAGARMKLVGGDSGRVEREEFVDGVLIAPSERAVVDVLFDRPGDLTLEHRTPDRTYRLATITVSGEPAEPGPAEQFAVLRTDPELTAERQRLDAVLAAPPDKILAVIAEMDDVAAAPDGPAVYTCPMHPEVTSDEPGRCPTCGMKLMAVAPGQETAHGHDMGHDMDHHSAGADAGDGIEWEDDMVEINRTTTPATMRWKLLDRTDGTDAAPDGWSFTVGDRVKIRLVNEMDSDHPMHHPFHLHGAGRFLVLARDGAAASNLVWKDTVLIRRGEVVDILFDITNPGAWMAHCHIPEHMASGMMFTFRVTESRPS